MEKCTREIKYGRIRDRKFASFRFKVVRTVFATTNAEKRTPNGKKKKMAKQGHRTENLAERRRKPQCEVKFEVLSPKDKRPVACHTSRRQTYRKPSIRRNKIERARKRAS